MKLMENVKTMKKPFFMIFMLFTSFMSFFVVLDTHQGDPRHLTAVLSLSSPTATAYELEQL